MRSKLSFTSGKISNNTTSIILLSSVSPTLLLGRPWSLPYLSTKADRANGVRYNLDNVARFMKTAGYNQDPYHIGHSARKKGIIA